MSAGGKAGWNPAFAKLLGPQAKKQKLGPPATPPLPLNGEVCHLPCPSLCLIPSNCGYAPPCRPASVTRRAELANKSCVIVGCSSFLGVWLTRPVCIFRRSGQQISGTEVTEPEAQLWRPAGSCLHQQEHRKGPQGGGQRPSPCIQFGPPARCFRLAGRRTRLAAWGL